MEVSKPPSKFKEERMKDLQDVKLERNNFQNFVIALHGISEKERCEFFFPLTSNKKSSYGECLAMRFIADNWEHVMLNLEEQKRCPTYEEMCILKETFWTEDEIAIQVHPKKSDYINKCQYALHLWRNKTITPQAEARLKRRISGVYCEAKQCNSEHGKEIFLSKHRVLVIFCGKDWLSWEEVCKIKQKYWEPEEAAVQFNVSPELDCNEEHMILLWDASDFDLPAKELV